MYKTELQLKRASSVATILMLIIVFTGVLGLVSLNVAKRNKEIGIRKVLGATASHVLGLLYREYAVVMIIAFLIGIPLSYLFVNQWLTAFVYHIELSWWIFTLPTIAMFALTMVVVIIQGLGKALENPVKAIRYE